MKITPTPITIGELVEGYVNNHEYGVVGYGGKLNIRPAYQREFVYKPDQQVAVIRSIMNKFPINVMYWGLNADGTYELIDGQQRTMSICQFINDKTNGAFSIDDRNFENLTKEEQEQILEYPFLVYICEGSEKEKLDWFEVINTVGERLTAQELRNAVYTGSWLTDAKRYFSRSNCPADDISRGYQNERGNRQELLELAISWAVNSKDDADIRGYMAKSQNKPDAKELWDSFDAIIKWVKTTFITKNRNMASVNWGDLYAKHKDRTDLDPVAIDEEIKLLIQSETIDNQAGIYAYVLDHDKRHLKLRTFDERTKQATYNNQAGICPACKKHFRIGEMHADHIKPWSKGGLTDRDNCQMLCISCNLAKSDN